MEVGVKRRASEIINSSGDLHITEHDHAFSPQTAATTRSAKENVNMNAWWGNSSCEPFPATGVLALYRAWRERESREVGVGAQRRFVWRSGVHP